MVLLAYDDISKSPYKELGTEDQLKNLSSIINLEILSVQMQSTGNNDNLIKRNCPSNCFKVNEMVTKPT